MIVYRESLEGIEPGHLKGFFVGWANPPRPEAHLRLLRGSDRVVLAWDEEAGRVVGFICALTDGVLNAYVPQLEVLPDWQGRGIGSELTRRMLARLGNLYAVDLLCDPSLDPFYARFEMLSASGMMLRRYTFQSGVRPPEGAGIGAAQRPSFWRRLAALFGK
jgi:GNAT superfamily N-acetyltransferase